MKNYKITKTAICDLFVGTYHVESVVLLNQIESKK